MNRAARMEEAQAARIDRKIERGRTAERNQEQRQYVAALAHTMANGYLGAFNDTRAPDICEAGIRELCSRLKAMRDGPAVAALLGAIAHDLNGDIKGGRQSARDAAERVFGGEGGE